MRKTLLLLLPCVLLLLVGIGVVGAQNGQQPDPGPPQFVTFPILLHVGDPGLDHGHFVFGEDVAYPRPLAPNLGTAPYSPVTTGTLQISGSGEVNVSQLSSSYEGETGATGLGSILVGASNHIYPGNCSATAASGAFGDCAVIAYASSDGGQTFSKQTISRTWNGTTFGITFDPGVDYDKTGAFYYSFGGAPLSGNFPNSVAVSRSTDGVNWSTPIAVTFNRNRFFDDKYYLAVDRSNGSFANRIYVSWDRNQNIIYVDKSTNGGVSWGKDVAAATTHAGFGTDIGCVGGRSQGPAHALKVGPSGALYLVYADPVSSPGSNRGFDILLTKSTDGGLTWSTPETLNDDTGSADQFHPTLSVDSNGTGGDKVTVTFYDRRDDPSNCLAYVYGTQSTDGGATWSANVRLTSAQSNFDGNPNGPGDYSSSTPFSAVVFPFFCDHRLANPETASGGRYDVYTVKVQ